MKTYHLSKAINIKIQHNLDQLIDELNIYSQEAGIWTITDTIANSAGNLAVHLVGNLNHFVGAVLGNTAYIRNRKHEFAVKNIRRKSVVESIEKVKILVKEVLASVDDEEMIKTYPYTFDNPNFQPKTNNWLLHLVSHLAYHVGQVNYHRRLLDKPS